MSPPNDTSFLAFAHQLADAAGDVIRPYFGAFGHEEVKDDSSPVTIADREAETAMRALVEKQFPGHGIYGEEHGQHGLDKKYIWAIDPIDGTRAFIAGSKEWGTLIALCENGVPILGILDQPMTGERWVGIKGEASTWCIPNIVPDQENTLTRNPEPIHASACSSLEKALISTTSKDYFTPPQAKAFVQLAEQCKLATEGGDCYAYGLLAYGARDLVVDAGLKPYDILALVPIIEGAGGVITGWDGKPVTLSNYANVLAAGDKTLHSQALALLQGA